MRRKEHTRKGVSGKKGFVKNIKHCWQLYVLLAPTVLYLFIFCYLPMLGIQIAFRDYTAAGGIWNSTWVGWKHFTKFFSSVQFQTLIMNTLKISVYSLIWGFPLPIILALFINECRFRRLRKIVQSLTYAPYFISTVVLVSMLTLFLNEDTGIVNLLVEAFGGKPQNFMGNAKAFRSIYIISGIWQSCGWSSIIYIAALSGVDIQLHEAARIDGAGRAQRTWYVDLPSIMPTVITVLILNCGRILSVGYEKVFLMQNTMNQSVSEVISTYVYKVGLLGAQYSYTTAISLFNSVINIIVLVAVNQIAKRTSEVSLF